MDNLQVFNFKNREVRTVMVNSEPWFVAKDVCEYFGDTNYRRSVSRIDEDEKTLIEVADSLGRNQQTIAVNESGLYSLLFGFQPEMSRKDDVSQNAPRERITKIKEFKRWVTHEVIPTIRKHGGYLTPQKVEEILCNPDTIIKLATDLKQEREKNLQLETKIQEDTPKVDYYEELVDRNCLINLRDTAKEFNKSPQAFNDWLTEKKLLYRDVNNKLKPYVKPLTDGLFELKEFANAKTSGNQTMVTPKGRSYIQNLLKKEEVHLK